MTYPQAHTWNNPIKYEKGKSEWDKILEKYGEEDKFKKPKKNLDSKSKKCSNENCDD